MGVENIRNRSRIQNIRDWSRVQNIPKGSKSCEWTEKHEARWKGSERAGSWLARYESTEAHVAFMRKEHAASYVATWHVATHVIEACGQPCGDDVSPCMHFIHATSHVDQECHHAWVWDMNPAMSVPCVDAHATRSMQTDTWSAVWPVLTGCSFL